jgi:hypothetical protein
MNADKENQNKSAPARENPRQNFFHFANKKSSNFQRFELLFPSH